MTTKPKVAAAPTAAWRNRIVGHGEEAPGQLLANPANWRLHPKEQQLALAGALSEVGWVAQVLVNRTTGHVVDGHLRVELAISRHEPSVPVVYVELSEDEERRSRPQPRTGYRTTRRPGVDPWDHGREIE